MTPETIQKLKDAFAIGATIEQACYYAEIATTTYHNWCKKYPVLLHEFDRMRQKLPLAAKTNIAHAIQAMKDLSMSKWLIEKTESETYGDKIKMEHSGEISDGFSPEVRQIREEFVSKMKSAIKSHWDKKNKDE